MSNGPSSRRLGMRQYFDDPRLRPRDIEIIMASSPPSGETGITCRGWLDLQVNGFAVDVLHGGEADLRTLSRRITATGVTALLPTVITAAPRETEQALRVIDRVSRTPEGSSARILGAHLEGPYLSAAYAGAHPPDLLRGDVDRLPRPWRRMRWQW